MDIDIRCRRRLLILGSCMGRRGWAVVVLWVEVVLCVVVFWWVQVQVEVWVEV